MRYLKIELYEMHLTLGPGGSKFVSVAICEFKYIVHIHAYIVCNKHWNSTILITTLLVKWMNRQMYPHEFII